MKYSIVFFVTTVFIFSSCDHSPTQINHDVDIQVIGGEAQGTTYSIKYTGKSSIEKSEIDSILDQVDLSLSAWVKESVLSQFNRQDSISVSDHHFLSVFYRGKEIHDLTDGAFQPMIMPLVKAWGFGPEGGELKEGENLDSLKQYVNYNFEINADEDSERILFANKGGYQLDVNGYAQGYSVDVVGEFLTSQGVENFMVEIGGEVLASGRNERGESWRIGVDKPESASGQRELEAIVSLEDAAVATSGSYRKFYMRDGKKYSHTIDPKTGEPVSHHLLSVTVLASNCMNADAFATAFMVMGVAKTKEFLDNHPEMNLDVFLIFDDGGKTATWTSNGLKEKIENL